MRCRTQLAFHPVHAASNNRRRAVNGLCVRAAGAGGQYAPAALDWRFWAAPQLHR
jgi:hypothetical protein